MMAMPPPVLVLARGDDPNRFAAYLAELLRMEGLNWLAVRDLDQAPLGSVEPLPRLVLACAVALDEGTASHLADHVRAGGALLAARPCPALTTTLGFPPSQPLASDWSSGYVLLDDNHPLVHNLPWVPAGIQYLGPAESLAPTSATGAAPASGVAAWLARFPGQRTRYPALIANQVGAGRAILFAYDPAESAVRQHQGRPEQSSTGAVPDFDGDGAFRPNDLFLGQLDPALRDVPQADLQRTLVLRGIEWLTAGQPLPQLWRFPNAAPAGALIDGDSDSMSLDDFRLALDTCDRYGVPFATYLKPEHVQLVEPGEARAARERGHRFGPHPWAGPRPTAAELRTVLQADCVSFAARYGYHPRIHRGHWLIWPGWIDHARSLQGVGIRLDANFSAGRGLQGGYVNGTGLPARFVDEDGRLLNIYEQSTISTDDGWLLSKTGLPALTLAEAIARSCDQIDAAVDRYHTVYHPYFHPVLLNGGRALPYPTRPWLEAVLAHCRHRGIHFLDAERWLEWNEARRSVQLVDLRYLDAGAGVQLSLRSTLPLEDVTTLVPLPADCPGLSLSIDGEPVDTERMGHPSTLHRHGRRYAAITCSLRADELRVLTISW
ncbi:MAG: hypothetical protein ACRDJN_30665, partial [Chloroflexota bacterium]